MKHEEFIVVVQWGGGMTYISSTHKDYFEAKEVAKRKEEMLNASCKGKRGARPHVIVWRRA